jgi:4-hydroxy-2-oxoheptanedioate aldolase
MPGNSGKFWGAARTGSCCRRRPPAPGAFVESCRYPHHLDGVDKSLSTSLQRLHGVAAGKPGTGLGAGTRGRGSEATAAAIWGVSQPEYMELCDPWPLNPRGELLLGVKLESPEGIAHCEEICATPGLGFAELGPGDLSLSLGYKEMPRGAYPPEMAEARERVLAACKTNGIAFLETGTPENIKTKIDQGVRVVAGHSEEAARIGRAYQKRTMPA